MNHQLNTVNVRPGIRKERHVNLFRVPAESGWVSAPCKAQRVQPVNMTSKIAVDGEAKGMTRGAI
jgi:hypothetical protein